MAGVVSGSMKYTSWLISCHRAVNQTGGSGIVDSNYGPLVWAVARFFLVRVRFEVRLT